MSVATDALLASRTSLDSAVDAVIAENTAQAAQITSLQTQLTQLQSQFMAYKTDTVSLLTGLKASIDAFLAAHP